MRDYTLVMNADDREKWGIKDLPAHDLESASATVAHLTRAVLYATDSDGYPVDRDLADVFAAAAAAQAVFTVESGDATGAAGLGGSVSLGPLSLTSRPATGTKTLYQRAADMVAPKTVEILAAHGLLNGPVGRAW